MYGANERQLQNISGMLSALSDKFESFIKSSRNVSYQEPLSDSENDSEGDNDDD